MFVLHSKVVQNLTAAVGSVHLAKQNIICCVLEVTKGRNRKRKNFPDIKLGFNFYFYVSKKKSGLQKLSFHAWILVRVFKTLTKGVLVCVSVSVIRFCQIAIEL